MNASILLVYLAPILMIVGLMAAVGITRIGPGTLLASSPLNRILGLDAILLGAGVLLLRSTDSRVTLLGQATSIIALLAYTVLYAKAKRLR